MSVMDGIGAAGRIRAMKWTTAQMVLILAMTDKAFDEDIRNSLQVGMNAHLSKPAEPEKLFPVFAQKICSRKTKG